MCVLREDHGSKAASLVSKYTPNPDTQKWRVRYHTTCCVALYRSLVMEHQSKGSRFLFDGALSPLLSSPLLVKRDVVNSGVSKGTIGMPRRWNKCIFFLFILFFIFLQKAYPALNSNHEPWNCGGVNETSWNANSRRENVVYSLEFCRMKSCLIVIFWWIEKIVSLTILRFARWRRVFELYRNIDEFIVT